MTLGVRMVNLLTSHGQHAAVQPVHVTHMAIVAGLACSAGCPTQQVASQVLYDPPASTPLIII